MSTLAVIIPCWNEEVLLPKMLNCLLQQTYFDWTAICVDDHSTDRTAEIIKSYQIRDKRIQYVRRDREPKGGNSCRNIGLDKAKDAKYVCFFDADDLVAPYCFEQRVKYMEEHPEIEAASFPALAFTKDINEEYGPVFGVKTFDDDLEAMLNNNLPFSSSTDIYRRECLIARNVIWDEDIKSKQDADFNIQMLLSGLIHTFEFGRADYFYRVGRAGVAKSIQSKKSYNSHIHFIDKVTQMVSAKYHDRYDFYLEAMITSLLGLFYNSWEPYFKLLRLPWMQGRYGFKLRIWLYLLTFKKDRRLLFYKYRKYSKQQNTVWIESMAKYRKEILERGVEV